MLLLTGFVFLLNSVINVGALRTVGAPWRVAFLAGFALAQVGEFAFVLAATGVASGLIGEEAQRTVVAVIALTMVMSPLWLGLARRLHALQANPPERLSLLLARLARDEARVLRLRSARLVQGGALLAAHLGGRIDRVIERHRGPRQAAAAARAVAAGRAVAEPPQAAGPDDDPDDAPSGRARPGRVLGAALSMRRATAVRLIAGVDEVGRGPLAGPVVAAAVILLAPVEGLADSKVLAAPVREQLAAALTPRRPAARGSGSAPPRSPRSTG